MERQKTKRLCDLSGVDRRLRTIPPSVAYRVVTLGPAPTSSSTTADQFLIPEIIRRFGHDTVIRSLVPSFEQGADAVAAGAADALLVPSAYAGYGDLFTRRDVEPIGLFEYDTPTYGLAGLPGRPAPTEGVLALHRTTLHMVGDLFPAGTKDRFTLHFAPSTSVAAAMTASGEACACVSNEHAVASHGLAFFEGRVWGRIVMTWIVFGRRS